jgi:hypothetical protein
MNTLKIALCGIAIAPWAGTVVAEELLCFQRDYSAGHLAANKNQTVEMIRAGLPRARSEQAKVWVTFRKSKAQLRAEEDAAATASANGEEPPAIEPSKTYATSLYCWAPAAGSPEGAWQCGVECDGGTFTAWPSGDAILLKTRGGFLVTGECSEPGSEEQPRYVTDINAIETTFKLFPVEAARCRD